MADQARIETASIAGSLKTHVDNCDRRAEKLALDLVSREERMRADQIEWRKGLGDRLDKQDAILASQYSMAWKLMFAVLSGASGIIVMLLHTFGVIK